MPYPLQHIGMSGEELHQSIAGTQAHFLLAPHRMPKRTATSKYILV